MEPSFWLIFFFVLIYLFFILYFGLAACRILVPGPGIKPASPEVEALSLNHWTAREAPFWLIFDCILHLPVCCFPPKTCYLKFRELSSNIFSSPYNLHWPTCPLTVCSGSHSTLSQVSARGSAW